MSRWRSRSPRRSPENSLLEALEAFVRDNDLDEKAERALMELHPPAQREVISKYVTGANKSAVVMRRIREAANSRPASNLITIDAGEIEAFVRDNDLDEKAEQALFDLPAPAQKDVISRYVTGTNKSAVVMRRIREAANSRPVCDLDEATWQTHARGPAKDWPPARTRDGGGGHPQGSFRPVGETDRHARPIHEPMFPGQPPPPQTAPPAHLGQPMHLPAHRGQPPPPQLPPPPETLRQFALSGAAPPHQPPPPREPHPLYASVGFRPPEPPPRPPPPPSWADSSPRHGPEHARTQPPRRGGWDRDPVADFVRENDLDEKVEEALRQQPRHVQDLVMEKYVTGHNKSAVVMRRISEHKHAQPLDPVDLFCEENDLDDGCARELKAQSREVQAQIIEKYVTGRNKSAVVMRRIRDLAAQPKPEPDAVAVFVAEYDLDEGVERALRGQPADIQQLVMEKYVTGNNKSAVVMRRIKDAAAGRYRSEV